MTRCLLIIDNYRTNKRAFVKTANMAIILIGLLERQTIRPTVQK